MLRPGLLALAASTVVAQPIPADLAALAARAQIDRPIVAWCRSEFRSGHAGAYAVAVTSAEGGGRYLVLAADHPVIELASFSGGAELACYTPDGARRLHRTIRESETIQGTVTPRFRTTVVCGFVENTRAVCWQRSPATGAFVTVGGWTT